LLVPCETRSTVSAIAQGYRGECAPLPLAKSAVAAAAGADLKDAVNVRLRLLLQHATQLGEHASALRARPRRKRRSPAHALHARGTAPLAQRIGRALPQAPRERAGGGRGHAVHKHPAFLQLRRQGRRQGTAAGAQGAHSAGAKLV
jgi:hypothetical protein